MTTTTSNSAAAPDWDAAQDAIEKNNIEVVRAYIDGGGSLDHQNGPEGMTLLMWAGFSQRPDIAELLIERGANVNIIDTNCNGTALMWAVETNSEKIVDLILAKDPEINYRDNTGETVLHYAARHASPAVILKILEKGARTDIKNSDQKDAIAEAAGRTVGADEAVATIRGFIVKREAEARRLEEIRQAAQQYTADTVEVCRSGASAPFSLSRKLVLKTPISAG